MLQKRTTFLYRRSELRAFPEKKSHGAKNVDIFEVYIIFDFIPILFGSANLYMMNFQIGVNFSTHEVRNSVPLSTEFRLMVQKREYFRNTRKILILFTIILAQ